jgi:hypothetical protein
MEIRQQILSQLNLESCLPTAGSFRSPTAWEDQIFYFLMIDHFSDPLKIIRDMEGNLSH